MVFIAYITNINMTTGAQPTSLANSTQVKGRGKPSSLRPEESAAGLNTLIHT